MSRKALGRYIRDSSVRLAGGVGIHMSGRTPHEELGRLIRSLRPVDSGIDLIRLGPESDGGYLVPDDLQGIEYAFSPGVGPSSGFEADLADRGTQVYLADFSVDGPAQPHPRFVFDKKFVGCVSENEYITLDDWKRLHIPDYHGDLLLQMDIDGAEFETLFSTTASLLAQFRIIVIEFHLLERLLNWPFFELTSRLFRKLLQFHDVVHIHPNNTRGCVRSGALEIPRFAEFTFFRKDRFRKNDPCRTFPHPLDRDNTGNSTLVLPKCWYL